MKRGAVVSKAIRVVQNYLVCAFPLVLACMVWSSLRADTPTPPIWLRAGWEILSWNLIVWFTVLILFLVALVTVPAVREKTLTRLANIRERDEREQYITGRAARASLVSTLSLLALLLFLSIFSVRVTHAPTSDGSTGAKRTLSIGMNVGFLDDAPAVAKAEKGAVFGYESLAISKTGILLMVLVWQLATFHVVARRES